MKRTLFTVALAAVLVGPAAVPAMAHEGLPHEGWHHGGRDVLGMLARRLDLTPDQRKAFEDIRQQYEAATKPQRDALHARMHELFALLREPSSTREQARSLDREVQALRGQLDEARLDAWFKARALLTPAQLQKLATLRKGDSPDHGDDGNR